MSPVIKKLLIWGMAFGWMGVTLVALIIPAPREWGVLGERISPYYDLVRPVLQPAAHVVLMFVMAWILMHCFSARSVPVAVLLSLLICLFLAIAFEGVQHMLPVSFGRAADWDDVVFSLSGAGAGCLFSLFLGWFRPHQDAEKVYER